MSDGHDALTGLQQVQDLLARNAQPAIGRTLGIDLIEASEGHSVFAGTPGEMHYNPMGGVHGGYAATLLDSACGIAVHTLLQPGQTFTTLELKVSYLRGMNRDTGPVRAEGRVIQMGRRAAFAEATVTDTQGRIMATATSTLLVMSK
jgi:uncharacterized protein (TIGR00369 family)